jgi:hypothetical protein
MLKLTNKTVEIERDEDLQETCTVTEYAVEGTVKLAMDSIWDYTGSDTVRVEGIQVRHTVYEDDMSDSIMVNVEHDATWDIYTDSGFEAAISAALGFDVTFTEQGMQDDNYASMEV